MTDTGHSGEMLVFEGIGVSRGVATGPAHLLDGEALRIVDREIGVREVKAEICRLEDALIETRRQIQGLQRDLAAQAGSASSSLLDAHLMMLDDRTFFEEVVQDVRSRRRNVERALHAVSERYAEALASVEDSYLSERVADIRDVTRRIIRNLSGDDGGTAPSPARRHVVVARDLSPSESAGLRKDFVRGFATDLGGATSHTAVMARALDIPAVVGLHDVSRRIPPGQEVLIDGDAGLLIVNPDPETLARYGEKAAARAVIQNELKRGRDKAAETRDGRRIVLSANMESVDEIDAVREYGAEGVGLFRSEYLYLKQGGVVEEDEQARVYAAVAAALHPAPVIVRTLDLGGDKVLAQEGFERETNPFLGCRSIRLSLLYPDHFKTQLRAILRASVQGNVKIMYPMIGNEGEVVRANELLEEAKQELDEQEIPFNRAIEVGIMIEVPAAALIADELARHAAFFSIGTNDLVQYVLAVDRINERVAYLYEPTHPAVLELLQRTIDAAHRQRRWAGVCGEMAGDPLLSPLLVGMGVDELSVAPTAVPLVKEVVRSVSYAESRRLAESALACRSATETLAQCRRLIQKTAPKLLELL